MEVLEYLWQAFSTTINIFLTLFLPLIFCCIILNVIANLQNKRLYDIAGWNGLLVTAWIGTPIHELSHYVAAKLSGHKIIELKLFKPDPRAGSLGYVTHSFDPNNFYQAIIGNTVIAIAPFFGGALAIYLLMYVLLPEFSLFAPDVPHVYYVTSDNFSQWESYVLFAETTLAFFKYLIAEIFSETNIADWRFYLFIFMLFGIANHLSPSASDFRNFWQPLTVIILFLTLLNLIVLPFTKNSMFIIDSASKYVLFSMPILLLAIFISLTGLILIYVVYFISMIFKR